MFYSILVSAPRGRNPAEPTNIDVVNDLSYGVIYNCPVLPGVCEGFEGFTPFFDNTGIICN